LTVTNVAAGLSIALIWRNAETFPTTRGVNLSISEGLQVESDQSGSHDLDEGLAAWKQRPPPNVAP